MPDRSAHGLGRRELIQVYEALCVSRAADERLEILQQQGHVAGELYRSHGQEAGSVGAAFALRRKSDGTGDFLAPTVGAAGALVLFGAELVDFFRQYLARGSAPAKGRETSLHWFDVHKGFIGPVSSLGTMIEVMAGITLSFRLRGEDRVGMVFHGDAASSTGAWHEGLNFAAVQQCPFIVMVENNERALSTRVSSFTKTGPAYGIGAESVDGTDVLAVFDAARRAAARARAGVGAQMVELRYFRAQDPAQEDPIALFRTRMLENDWATENELLRIEEEAFERCRVSAEQAIGEPVRDGSDAIDNVYEGAPANRPWTRADTPEPALA